jgi:hypothetical protein
VLAVCFALRIEVAVCVQSAKLIAGLQQKLALALTVNIDQQRAELTQRGDRHRLVVYVRAAPAGAVQAAQQDELVVVKRSLQNRFGRLPQTVLG